ncbi:MAG TPA: hypothetical protein VML50_10470 [Anaeromyxobacter sp.]|nr:hypothetical protein [Anaeromyxobacter sp.]
MVGDHIRARKGGRWQHGIDCGDQTVIHLVTDAGVPGSRFRRSFRPEFLAGSEAVEVVTHRERVYPPRQVVARAFSRNRDSALSAMFRDSEQFALWCKIGQVFQAPAAAEPGAPAAKARPAGAGGVGRKAARPAARKAAPMKAARKAARPKPARRAPRKAAKAKPARGRTAKKPAARGARRSARRAGKKR